MLYLYLICLLVIIGIGLAIIWKYKYEIIVVRGVSMLPTLSDGDLVLIDKKPKVCFLGDICVVRPPDKSTSIVIKRISKVRNFGEQYWFLGDNRNHSHDSRDYGWVNNENIEGRVIKVWRRKQSN